MNPINLLAAWGTVLGTGRGPEVRCLSLTMEPSIQGLCLLGQKYKEQATPQKGGISRRPGKGCLS